MEKTHRLIFAGFALLLAVFYDLFFWKNEMGLGALIFILIYVTGFLLIVGFAKQFRNKWSLLFLIPVLVMSIDMLMLNNKMVRSAVPVFVLILLFVFSVFATLRNPNRNRFSLAKIPVISNIFIIFGKFRDLKNDLIKPRKDSGRQLYKKIIRGIVISIPFLLFFGILFASADPIFDEWIKKIFSFDLNTTLVWRISRTILSALIISGFFYMLLSEKHSLGEKIISALKLDSTTTAVVIGLINLLFLLFVFIQIKYLFGNENFVIENGITFAQYARNGFFELVWVMIFSAIILGVIYKSFSHHGESKIVTMLQLLLIIQVGVIALSALKRMNLYQDAYGYTILRLYVEWFIYLVLTLLIFGGASLVFRFEFRKYFYSSLIICLSALTVVASINVDYLIAKQNISRFINKGEQENIRLDINYINNLSLDTVPAFKLLKGAKLNSNQLELIKNLLSDKESELEEDNSILEYNIGRQKTKNTINSLKEYFNNYSLKTG